MMTAPVWWSAPGEKAGTARVVQFDIITSRQQAPLKHPPFHRWKFRDGGTCAEFYRVSDAYLVRFPHLADFEVSSAAHYVRCFPAPHVHDETPQQLYYNQILPLVLSANGGFVFHGSAVAVENRAVAFLAESGRGKSTLAAKFATDGYRLLTDDALVLERSKQGFDVRPGHASLRLWQDSREMLASGHGQMAPPLLFTRKSRLLAGDTLPFCAEARTLGAAYFLGDGNVESLVLRRLSPAEALLAWARNCFLLDVEDRSTLQAHFGRAMEASTVAPSFHLDYPREYSGLTSVQSAVLDHFSKECAAK